MYIQENDLFRQALIEQDVKRAKELIQTGKIDINYISNLETPLLIAIRSENPDLLELVLSAGANVDLIEGALSPIEFCLKTDNLMFLPKLLELSKDKKNI